ncbi:hypothetical protein ACWWJF_19935 [Symbiopectobacterium sp. Eva_TO]
MLNGLLQGMKDLLRLPLLGQRLPGGIALLTQGTERGFPQAFTLPEPATAP